MDYILVMEKGQLVEQGTLAELIEKDGYYVQLMKQMREDANDGKQPTTKDVWKNDQWVRPFLKRYKNLVFCLYF